MTDPSPETPTEEAWLDLPFDAFDQDHDGGWRAVAHRDDYPGAARMIERYLERHPDLEAGQQRILHFHAGQMTAYAGDYPAAIAHFRRSLEDPERTDSPIRWNAYVRATIAFLEKDREALLRCRQLIAEGPTYQGEHLNLNVVDGLIARFDRPYSEAYGR